MVLRKPSDMPPVEMTGTLFGGTMPKPAQGPTGFRGWLARAEQRVIGLPWPRIGRIAAVVAAVVAGAALWQSRAVVGDMVTAYVAKATGAVVEKIVVSGTVYTGKDELQAALGLKKGDSLVGFDAGAARARIEQLPWVRLASVDRMLPDRVNVTIYEQVPLARLVDGGQIWVINKDGQKIVADSGNAFAGLPVLQGDGAAEQAGVLFARMANWPQLLSQLREAEWVGDRRWNLKFASGVVVKLPEESGTTADAYGAAQALPLLAKLEETRHVLTLNDGEVDLRLPDRVVLHLPDTVGDTPVTQKPAAAG